MVPEGWEKLPLADVCDEKISYGIVQAGPHIEQGIPYIKSSDLNSEILPDKLQRTSEAIHTKYIRSAVHPGDIIFSLRGNIGLCQVLPDSISVANLTQGTARISIKAKFSTGFFKHQLESSALNKLILAKSKGSTFQEISLEALRKLPVLVPPLSEQEKIAKILSSWDDAITTVEQLLGNSQQQKKALAHLLLTGKQRLSGFSSGWETILFGEAFRERVETGFIELPLLSITSEDGVVNREETRRKDTSNSDKSKYLRICPGDIGYNTMRMWQGVSGLSTLEGLVSPAYTVLTPKPEVDPLFASYLFKLPALVHVFYRHSQGLVSDTWNLKYSNFAKIKWSIPSVEEQKTIAAVLAGADREIEILRLQLAGLKQERKALMQQLLTGKRRVKVDEPEVA